MGILLAQTAFFVAIASGVILLVTRLPVLKKLVPWNWVFNIVMAIFVFALALLVLGLIVPSNVNFQNAYMQSSDQMLSAGLLIPAKVSRSTIMWSILMLFVIAMVCAFLAAYTKKNPNSRFRLFREIDDKNESWAIYAMSSVSVFIMALVMGLVILFRLY